MSVTPMVRTVATITDADGYSVEVGVDYGRVTIRAAATIALDVEQAADFRAAFAEAAQLAADQQAHLDSAEG